MYLKVQSCILWNVAGESAVVHSTEVRSLGVLDVASGFQQELVKSRAGCLAPLGSCDIPVSAGVSKDQ